MSTAKQYCIQELRKRLGFNEVEEIAAHILSDQNPAILTQEVQSILGEGPETDKFVRTLLDKLRPDKQKANPKQKQKEQKLRVCFVP